MLLSDDLNLRSFERQKVPLVQLVTSNGQLARLEQHIMPRISEAAKLRSHGRSSRTRCQQLSERSAKREVVQGYLLIPLPLQ